MAKENIGKMEARARVALAFVFVVAGVLFAGIERSIPGVAVLALCVACGHLLFKSARERYCPCHDRLGIDTRRK